MSGNEHYYSADPKSEIILQNIDYTIGPEKFRFLSSSGIFSKSEIDEGSDALIRATLKSGVSSGRLLDIGCGYGVIGVVLARMLSCEAVLCDINPRAAELAGKNITANGVRAKALVSDGFNNIEGLFNMIVTNPPIRAGKDIYFGWFESAPAYLSEGGSFWCVIRKKQGAPSAKDKLAEMFGNCEIMSRDKGYYILMARKIE